MAIISRLIHALPLGALATLCVSVTACGILQDLTHTKAAELIRNDRDFQARSDRALFREALYSRSASVPVVSALRQLGFVDVRRVDGGFAVYLNQRGLQAAEAQRWQRDPYKADGAFRPTRPQEVDQYPQRSWKVPLANPELIEVTDIRIERSATARVQFNYRWKPNEIGRLYSRERWEKTRTSSARLTLDDEGWKVEQIGGLS
ncbi:MAG: hypothetical protein H7Y22_14215 [Gemmatimonadaceae bacterium]|nr:hypothetical protein [Gloeobacterales cyanobacterium ES-bin-141]